MSGGRDAPAGPPGGGPNTGPTSGGHAPAGVADDGPNTSPAGQAGATRRQFVLAVLLCAAGAGLAMFAATRHWAVEVTARPAGLPPVQVARTGEDVLPWLPAVAAVELAGAGAVLATRGTARRLVGILLLLASCVVTGGAAYGVTLPERSGLVGPAAGVLGGLLAASGAALVALRGQHWPGMGARYENRPPAAGPAPAAGGPVAVPGTTAAWDALDRGEDPTDDQSVG